MCAHFSRQTAWNKDDKLFVSSLRKRILKVSLIDIHLILVYSKKNKNRIVKDTSAILASSREAVYHSLGLNSTPSLEDLNLWLLLCLLFVLILVDHGSLHVYHT